MELLPNEFKRMLPLPVTGITTADPSGIANGCPFRVRDAHPRPLELITVASAPMRQTLRNIREV